MRISKSTILKAATAFLVAALVSTGTVPSIVSKAEQAQAQTNWTVFDNPSFGPQRIAQTGWQGGSPNEQYGYGPGRYFGNSNYAYATSAGGWNPSGSWVEWILSHGPLAGTYEIQAYVPGNHAAATAEYWISECIDNLGCAVSITPPITQYFYYGWVSLGEYEFNGDQDEVKISLEYDHAVTPYNGNDSVAFDAMRMRCVSCTIVDDTGAGTSAPSKIHQLTVADSDDERIDLSWSVPSSGSQITGYDIDYMKRYDDGSRSDWRRIRSDYMGTDITITGLSNGQIYDFRVRAGNRYGEGLWSDFASGVPRTVNQLYIVDDPVLTGNFSRWQKVRCANPFDNPTYCWSRYRPYTDTYWYRSGDSVILRRWSQANDVWGTNGFHVTRLESGKRRLATWNFNNVPGDRYWVQVYIPDVQKGRSNEYRYQPGAIAKYTISYGSTNGKWRTIQHEVDQSEYNNQGGQWVSLAPISVRDGKKVRIRVGSYSDSNLGLDRSAASGQQSWKANLAVDAARLMPISPTFYYDTAQIKDAKSWCVTDTIFKIFLDPFVKILEGKLVEMAKGAAVEAALTAISVAAGPVGTALRGVAAISRVGLLVKRIDSVWDTIDIIKKIVRVVEKIKDKIIDRVQAGRELTTLISEVGDIVVNPEDQNRAATDLTALCEREDVWENYYGGQRFWDRVKLGVFNLIVKLL